MPHFPLGLTMGMLLSFPMLILGAFLMWTRLQPRNARA
jgi:phosphatidylglycerol:prolipoprotein diacylglycerol transferase